MPTYERSDSFRRDYKDLNREERERFKSVVKDEFVPDLEAIEQGRQATFRGSLRVKPLQGNPGIWEMTWEGKDGRATFDYGPPQIPGLRHVRWRRVGGHDIFGSP